MSAVTASLRCILSPPPLTTGTNPPSERYDLYITGLRGAAAVSSVNNHAVEGDASSTDIVNAENGGGEADRVRRVTSGKTLHNLNLASGAGGALERALQQLAALGGESMTNRISVRN